MDDNSTTQSLQNINRKPICYLQLWQFTRLACQLQFHSVYMILIQMHITKSMNKIRGCKPHSGHHHQQSSITSNMNTNRQISRTLIQLAIKRAIGDIKLKTYDKVARPFRQIRNIPSRNQMTSTIRIIFQPLKVPLADQQPPAAKHPF